MSVADLAKSFLENKHDYISFLRRFPELAHGLLPENFERQVCVFIFSFVCTYPCLYFIKMCIFFFFFDVSSFFCSVFLISQIG
jgi:hypothetical protein